MDLRPLRHALHREKTDAYHRVSMHGVRRELLALQARELGLPLVEITIPPACPNELYEARLHEAFASEALSEVVVLKAPQEGCHLTKLGSRGPTAPKVAIPRSAEIGESSCLD
jgi:hypothetical protein